MIAVGGRGGSSGLTSKESFSVGETVKVGNYKVKDGEVTTKSGKTQSVTGYKELTAQEKEKYKSQLEKAGISDPVIAGRMILPRNVVETAIRQRESGKRAIEKNVPGLEKLREARRYDDQQRRIFNRSVEGGSGIIRGNPNSTTASGLAKKYPRAAAYLKAESYFNSSNYMKSSFGKEAMNKIANGKSASAAIKEMEKKWRKYASKSHD